MAVREVGLQLIEQLPADVKQEGERPVVVSGQPWLLVASRKHPQTGVVNGLLLSPDRSRAAVAPMTEVVMPPIWESQVADEPPDVVVEFVAAATASAATPRRQGQGVVQPTVPSARARKGAAKPKARPGERCVSMAAAPVDQAAEALARAFQGDVVDAFITSELRLKG